MNRNAFVNASTFSVPAPPGQHAAGLILEPLALLERGPGADASWRPLAGSRTESFSVAAAGPRRLEIRGTFPAGLIRFDLATRNGAFEMDSLYVHCRFTPGHGRNLADPEALPTGPWDYINDRFVVPRFEVAVNGRAHPEYAWMDLPGLDDLAAGRARTSFALRFESGGERTVALNFTAPESGDERLRADRWGQLAIGVDERQAALEPSIALRPELRGIHPRLWITPGDLGRLREEIAPGGARHGVWRRFLQKMEKPKTPDPLGLALRFLLLGERGALEKSSRAGEEIVAREHWGQPLPGHMGCDNDIAAGSNLFLLAMLLDWTGAALDEATRARWTEKLVHHARLIFRFALFQRAYLPTGYLQNHFSGAYHGLGAAGVLLLDHPEHAREAAEWMNWVGAEFQRRTAQSPPDGSGHALDLTYGLRFFMRFSEALRSACGVELIAGPHYERTLHYAFHRNPPARGYGGYRSLLWLLARRFDDATARAFLARDAESSGAGVEELLWYDPRPLGNVKNLPLTRTYEDSGEVYLHTDRAWRGDADGLLSFRAGLSWGRTHQALHTRYNYAHFLPDQGAVRFWHRGRCVLGEAGRSYRKLTSHYNCLTVNGHGQFGDTFVWMPKLSPDQSGRLIATTECGPAVQISAALEQAYPETLGLERYHRAVLFVRWPQPWLLIVDRVMRRPGVKPGSLEWHFHAPCVRSANTGGAPFQTVRIGTEREPFLLSALDPGGGLLEQEVGETPVVVQYTHQGGFQQHVTWKTRTDGACCVTGIFVARPLSVEAALDVSGEDLSLRIESANLQLEVSGSSGEAGLPKLEHQQQGARDVLRWRA